MSRLLDVLLGTEPIQRARLAQAGLAMLLLAGGVLAMVYFVWIGQARAPAVALWGGLTFLGMLAFFGMIRSGWSRRRREPSLTSAGGRAADVSRRSRCRRWCSP